MLRHRTSLFAKGSPRSPALVPSSASSECINTKEDGAATRDCGSFSIAAAASAAGAPSATLPRWPRFREKMKRALTKPRALYSQRNSTISAQEPGSAATASTEPLPSRDDATTTSTPITTTTTTTAAESETTQPFLEGEELQRLNKEEATNMDDANKAEAESLEVDPVLYAERAHRLQRVLQPPPHGKRAKRPLKPKLLPQKIKRLPVPTPTESTGKAWILPSTPSALRCPTVQSLLRPLNVRFFRKVGCDCENCTESPSRNWDIVNGMSCAYQIPSPAPPMRRKRELKTKDRSHVSILHRRFPSAATVSDLFNNPRLGAGSTPASSTTVKGANSLRPTSIVRGSADWKAEVVVLITSLHTSHFAFYDSMRVLQLLQCKGVEFFAFDVNTDVGDDLPDRQLYLRWRHLRWIHRDPLKSAKRGNDIMVPQVVIDGVPIGGMEELQVLEDEMDLDYLLAQEACPNCLFNRVAPCGRPPKLNPNGTLAAPSSLPESDTSSPAPDSSDIAGAESTSNENSGECGTETLPRDYCFKCGATFRELVNSALVPAAQLDLLVARNANSLAPITAPRIVTAASTLSTMAASIYPTDEPMVIPAMLEVGGAAAASLGSPASRGVVALGGA